MTPENNQDHNPQPTPNQAEFMVGALIGAVAGAAAALLLTPKSGKEMRHSVKEYAKEFEGEAYELAKEAKGVTKSLRQVLDEGVTNLAEHAPEQVEKVGHQAQAIGNTLEQHITAAKDTVSEIAEAFRSGWEEYGEVLEEVKEAQEKQATQAEESKDVPQVLAVEVEEDSPASPESPASSLQPPASTDEVGTIPSLQSRRRGQSSHLLSDDTASDPKTVRPVLASQEIDSKESAEKTTYSTKVIEEVEPTKKEEAKTKTKDKSEEEPKPTKTRSVKVEVTKEEPKKPGKKLFFRKK